LKWMAGILGIFTLLGFLWSGFFVISGFALGYTIHLLMDATTTVGLPD